MANVPTSKEKQKQQKQLMGFKILDQEKQLPTGVNKAKCV